MYKRQVRSGRLSGEKKKIDRRTKNMSVSILTLKPSQFISPTQNQVNFGPNIEIKSISMPTLKTSQFSMSPDTKTKQISIQTLNQVIFDPHTKNKQIMIPTLKSSRIRPPTLKSSLFRPPTQQ